VCIVLSILVLSLVSTFDFNTYIRSQETLAYLIGNGSLLSIHYNLPGVFASNPYPRAVNGSLWTLPFEIGCYIMAATIYGIGMLAGAKYRSWLLYLAFAISILLALSAPQLTGFRGAGRVTAFAQLAFCFLIGMIFVRTGMSGLRWWHGPALGAVAWLFSATVAYDVIFRVAIAIGALWLAFVPSKLLRRLSAAPDYSFGIYIYAFPIQQLLISQAPSLAPPAHAVFAFLLILIPAALSWHFVEKPALRLKPKGPVAIEMNQYEKNAEEVEATPDLNPLKQRDFCDG
jgi:peptidoglycan/LPS O-acetylase OafA/YrhL